MSTSTWSGVGRTLDIGADIRFPDLTSLLNGCGRLLAIPKGNERLVLRTDIVRRGSDDLVVCPLFQDMRRPSGGAGDYEQRREHRGWHTHHVIRDGRKPV